GSPNHRGMSLLAMAVGIKQKELVNKLIQKFPPRDFVVMLFHYDGVVDDWKQYPWNEHAIHVSVMNQTKWWFAKRFLHPDIVTEYEYIFLWDEDLGVSHFNPKRYLSIVKEEGLHISQPALDTTNSEVHHPITARRKNLKFHRRMYKNKGSGRCDDHSTNPPCIGWVEMMAPVFSREAWRCSWYMIQNDLIHAWGLDMQLGYCAQGDRKKNVGVVDAEYIVHYGLPTLGVVETASSSSQNEKSPGKVSEESTEYLSIVKEEGLHISQPALDTTNSEVHHPITARRKNLKFHRRMYKNKGSGRCDDHSTNPPCIGWVEMMAPVFSREAWRCSWYMIQNDLIHAWGLDMQLGYCAQGDRKKNVGVVDAEYIVHYGLPTLGVVETASSSSQNEKSPGKVSEESTESHEVDNRPEVRMKSFLEMKRFKERWKKAVNDDICWVDPY
ncbi:hypothetical protein F2Q69_00033442, partial [Brassica cretica]